MTTVIVIGLIVIVAGLAIWSLMCTACHKNSVRDEELVLSLIVKTISGEISWEEKDQWYHSLIVGDNGEIVKSGYIVGQRCAFIDGNNVTDTIGRPIYAIRKLKSVIRRSLQ